MPPFVTWQESSAATRIVETDANTLWAEEPQPDEDPDQESDEEPALSMTAVSSTFNALSLAQHAYADMLHKACVGMFVPHNRLLSILTDLKLVPSDSLRDSCSVCPSPTLSIVERSKVLTCGKPKSWLKCLPVLFGQADLTLPHGSRWQHWGNTAFHR